MKISKNQQKSLYSLFKIKFISCANYYLKLSWDFSVKIHLFRVKNFNMLKMKLLKNKQKALCFLFFDFDE